MTTCLVFYGNTRNGGGVGIMFYLFNTNCLLIKKLRSVDLKSKISEILYD
jgi:hypothetical protein